MSEPLTIHYGDGPLRTDRDRTGLPADCICPAIRWCGQPPHIQWPDADCPRHGQRPPKTSEQRVVLRLNIPGGNR